MWRPDHALRRGDLIRVRPGVYAATEAWSAAAPWERYLSRVHAVALTHPDSVFCLESSLALRGFPIVGEPDAVHVLRDTHSTSRDQSGMRVHTCANLVEIEEIGSIFTTSTVETAVAVARLRHPAYSLAVADAALRRDELLSVEALVAHNESRPSTRGRRQARWSLHRASPLPETILESISRAAIEWLGFAEPDLQSVVADASGALDRPDFLWKEARVIGEADGALKYDGRFGAASDVLLREKRREDRLRRTMNGFARWGWSEVQNPDALEAILIAAGVPRDHPQNPTLLHGLRVWLTRASRGETARFPQDSR